MPSYKLGRLHRSYDPRIPHMSALRAGQILPPPPPAVDWTESMPKDLGMMRNDTLGDCTCAAFYHALQVWTFNTGKIDTEPDNDVEKLYILACGYNPRLPGEGPGGNEQQVLTYLLNQGAPIGPKGQQRHQIAGFVEVDPRNTDDVKRAIDECGVAYIGFSVPQYIVPASPAAAPTTWTVQTTNDAIVGGHAVVLAGYNDSGLRAISWGSYYTMTWDFFAKYVDEVYAIADTAWIEKKGTSPGGLSLDELELQMQALKEA